MHPGNPFTNGDVKDIGRDTHAFSEIFQSGSVANTRFNADLDALAGGLSDLQRRGLPVLLRPFHEMNGDWFWWSYGDSGRITKEEYTTLWTYTFTYLTNRNIHNVLWVYSPNASMWENGVKDTDYYYPGARYVDLVALDYYNDDLSQVNNHQNYDKLVALGKPLGFGEFGPQSNAGFDNAQMLTGLKKSYPKIQFALYWHGWGSVVHTNRAIRENGNAKAFMTDPTLITLSLP